MQNPDQTADLGSTIPVTLPSFDTQESAAAWAVEQVDDPCIDNNRFAFKDDKEASLEYLCQQARGCCGSFDADVIVAGRHAQVGFNYGH